MLFIGKPMNIITRVIVYMPDVDIFQFTQELLNISRGGEEKIWISESSIEKIWLLKFTNK